MGKLPDKKQLFRESPPQNTGEPIIAPDIVIFIAIISFLLYIALGGYAALKGLYAGVEVPAPPMAEYIYMFTPVSLLVLMALEIRNRTLEDPITFQWENIHLLTILFVAFYIVSMLLIGKRAIPLQIILLSAGLYTLFYKPLSLFRMTPVVILGIVGLYFLAVYRDTSDSLNFQLAESLMDLIINNRSTFIAVDYVDNNGITWGRSMLSYTMNVIPFLQTAVHSIFHIDPMEMSSSTLITRISLGNDDLELGFGTNIIADLYMAWGLPGTIILMAFLGYSISWLLKKAPTSLYALITYGIMMSYAVYSVRAEYTFPLQMLVWSLLMVNIVKHYNVRLTIKRDPSFASDNLYNK